MRKMLWCCCLAHALLIASCGEDEVPEAPVEVRDPAADLPEVTPVGEVMRDHFVHASDAREAMVRGDMEGAGEHMDWLATHQRAAALPEDLRPLLLELQSEAGQFGEAETLTEAGTVLARTLTRCGGCHRVANAGPEIAVPPIPEGAGVNMHMRRHQWAAERMWEGLVTESEESYNAGAEVLREAALHESEVPGSEEAPEARVEPITTHVHELGAEARDATDWPERADIYGRLLATCATCHRMLGAGPEGTVSVPQGVQPAAEDDAEAPGEDDASDEEAPAE